MQPKALVVDFLATLVRPVGGVAPPRLDAVSATLGYPIDPIVFGRWNHRFEGASHRASSASAQDYQAWHESRVALLLEHAGIAVSARPGLAKALLAALVPPALEPYPETAGALAELRSSGFALAICANWGWNLDVAVAETGLAGLVDAVVCSARVGARKPNSEPYLAALRQVGARPLEAIAVGTSWGTDVLAPTAVGMAAIHLWRPEEHLGHEPPARRPGVRRVGDLGELVAVLAHR